MTNEQRKPFFAFGFQYKVKADYPHISWYMSNQTNMGIVIDKNKNAPMILGVWKVVNVKYGKK
jgi:hypothetical protein